MGMMGKMRSLAPWFIITVGGLFVLFMVLSDSKVTEIIGQRSNDVGSINGKNITYQEFAKMVEQYKSMQTKQYGRDIPESQMEYFRDQIWDLMVSQEIINEKINEYGISVSDEEIKNVILGPNPPEYLKQGFIDSNGVFNRNLYEQALFDPRNKNILIQEEARIREQLLQQKLREYVNASVTVTDEEARKNYIENNLKMSADFVAISATSIKDSEVEVTDEMLKNYYDKNKEDYKIFPQRKIKYVLFRKSPSNDDTLAVKADLDAIVKKLKKDTVSFKTYVDIYSDNPFSIDTTTATNTPSVIFTSLKTANNGDIIGPELTFNGYVIYKLNKKIKSKNIFVKASHILIKSGADVKKARKEADDIYQQLKNGANFEELAKTKSQDGTASKGGDLGWFGEGTMVDEFWKAAKSGTVGKIQKPVKTQFGYHIILVTDKTNYEYEVEKIVNKIAVSPTTIDNLSNKAEDFSYLANKNDFEKEAELLQYKVNQSIAFREEANAVPGIGINRALVKFAFENNMGDVGQVYNVSAGYLVPMVSEVINEGYKGFEEVKGEIKSKVLRKTKINKTGEIAAKIKEKIGTSGNLEVAKEVFSEARISSAADFSINKSIPGVGREVGFISYAETAQLNSISSPIKGSGGYFLVKVTSRSKIDEKEFDSKKDELKKTLFVTKQNRYFQEWLTKEKENADVVDERYKIYR